MIIKEEIDKIKERIQKDQKLVDNLEKLSFLFPDLKKETSRGGIVRYYSAIVNNIANKADIGNSCGCCHDSLVEVRPYIETEYGKVYSDPPVTSVGYGFGKDARPNENWRKKLQSLGLSEIIIQLVKEYFEIQKQIRIKNALEDVEQASNEIIDD